ncbi:MAG: hypothetical protein ATN36_03515 [Epulopiscium sp. Nele67-Bin005]|nr:MAG: hypothetical protein ATN36_03515 [Epulopiscium sp. Nele67-Bin005]
MSKNIKSRLAFLLGFITTISAAPTFAQPTTYIANINNYPYNFIELWGKELILVEDFARMHDIIFSEGSTYITLMHNENVLQIHKNTSDAILNNQFIKLNAPLVNHEGFYYLELDALEILTNTYQEITDKPQISQQSYYRNLLSEPNSDFVRPSKYSISGINHVKQMPELPTGCEATALTIILQHAGLSITKQQVANDMPKAGLPYVRDGVVYGENPHNAFLGDPYADNGLGIYSRAIVGMINNYFPNQAYDLTGKTFDDVLDAVGQGMPVMVWVTSTEMTPSRLNSTWTDFDGNKVEWRNPLHAQVIIGYDNDKIYVSDPGRSVNSSYQRSVIEKVWLEMGSQAVAINPKSTFSEYISQNNIITEQEGDVLTLFNNGNRLSLKLNSDYVMCNHEKMSLGSPLTSFDGFHHDHNYVLSYFFGLDQLIETSNFTPQIHHSSNMYIEEFNNYPYNFVDALGETYVLARHFADQNGIVLSSVDGGIVFTKDNNVLIIKDDVAILNGHISEIERPIFIYDNFSFVPFDLLVQL